MFSKVGYFLAHTRYPTETGVSRNILVARGTECAPLIVVPREDSGDEMRVAGVRLRKCLWLLGMRLYGAGIP